MQLGAPPPWRGPPTYRLDSTELIEQTVGHGKPAELRDVIGVRKAAAATPIQGRQMGSFNEHLGAEHIALGNPERLSRLDRVTKPGVRALVGPMEAGLKLGIVTVELRHLECL